MVTRQRVATTLNWVFAPERLTIERVCLLSHWDQNSMLEIIDESGVDLDDDGLIDKASTSFRKA